MTPQNAGQLATGRCTPCEEAGAKYTRAQAKQLLAALPDWRLSDDARRIHREWQVKDFTAGIEFFVRVAELAEAQGHHPDLHLEGYRDLRIELWTHAVGGLSQNDFILAAEIDRLPVRAARPLMRNVFLTLSA